MSSGCSGTQALCCAYTAGPSPSGISRRLAPRRPRGASPVAAASLICDPVSDTSCRVSRSTAPAAYRPGPGCPGSVHIRRYPETTRSTGSGRRRKLITPARSDPVHVIRVAPAVPANSYTGA